MKNYPCILRRERFKEVKLPARLYGYLTLCQNLKYKRTETDKKEAVISGNLPFVSEMIRKSSQEAVRHVNWTFLRY